MLSVVRLLWARCRRLRICRLDRAEGVLQMLRLEGRALALCGHCQGTGGLSTIPLRRGPECVFFRQAFLVFPQS